ncbi:MAG: hydroxymethylglutaryl-CoA reductase [Gemmatimonadaceae bacterium]
MTIDHRHALASLESLLQTLSPEELRKRLMPKKHAPPPKVVSGSEITPEAVQRRWAGLPSRGTEREMLLDAVTVHHAPEYARHVENFVGTVKVPVGVAGHVRVNGSHAQGDYYVPMATLEATLVASYSRGAQLITAAGGCAAATIRENVSRAPGFAFQTLHEAGQFVAWAAGALPKLKHAADSTSRYGRVQGMRISLEGNHVYLIFDFSTGDAAGQNIVTIATQAICEYITRECPLKPVYAFLESNHSGDKKASAQSFMAGRGRSVTAEVVVPRGMVESRLHTTPELMCRYWAMSAIGGVLSGTIGVQGHYANGLAAIYLACGQDVACVAESAVGVTRMEMAGEALYVSVTLPNLVVGTVGGGTALPSQRACLDMLGLAGAGNANAFAEVCAAIALAGELSIVGALCAGEFAQAHARLARGGAVAAATAAHDGGHA